MNLLTGDSPFENRGTFLSSKFDYWLGQSICAKKRTVHSGWPVVTRISMEMALMGSLTQVWSLYQTFDIFVDFFSFRKCNAVELER